MHKHRVLFYCIVYTLKFKWLDFVDYNNVGSLIFIHSLLLLNIVF